MTRYIAFLRAINVGGRMVKMEDLKKIFTLPGIKNITTYIQSGNVAFDCATTDRNTLAAKIAAHLQKALGFEVKTLVRSQEDIVAIIAKNPFPEFTEDMALHVTFLSVTPDKEAVKLLEHLQSKGEQFRINDTELYLLLKKGAYGETKFSNTFLEKKLQVNATTRNWATVNKMAGL